MQKSEKSKTDMTCDEQKLLYYYIDINVVVAVIV